MTLLGTRDETRERDQTQNREAQQQQQQQQSSKAIMTPDDKSTMPIAPPRHRLRTRKQQNNLPTFHRRSVTTAASSSHCGHGKLSIAAICLVVVALSLSFRSLEGDYAGGDVVDGDGSGGRRALQVELVQPANSYNSRMEALAASMIQTETEEDEEPSYNEISPAEIEDNQAFNRMLIEGLDKEEIEGITAVPEFDALADFRQEPPAEHFNRPSQDQRFLQNHQTSSSEQSLKSTLVQSQPTQSDYETLISNSIPLPKYDLPSLLQQIKHYSNTFTVLIYDPQDDTFYALYSKKHHWASANEKLIKALKSITYLIRRQFPEKLKEELALGISSGDYPAVKITECVRLHSGVATGHERRVVQEKGVKNCSGDGSAAVMHFGSTFRHTVFPNMISMPMPEPHHLKCYEQWATNDSVCSQRKRLSRIGDNGLFQDPTTGEDKRFDWSSSMWDTLIPQVVWRGTDFVYLQTLYPELGRPSLGSHIAPHLPRESTIGLKKQAIQALESAKAGLVPRWKGVLHTADAELAVSELIEQQGRTEGEKRRMKDSILPWCNIKFSHFVSAKGVKSATKGSQEYKMWERMDFPAAGESLGMDELAKYKYHIDLGGGGGTTWSGTIQKLALPGLLFHHVTPTQDYIHKYMKPWKHYVPVAPDLRDLKEKFDWAESHPNQASKIAHAGSRLARFWSSEKGMAQMFAKDIEEPMRAVLDSYVPVSQTEHKGKSWRKVIMEIEGQGMMLPILKCTGKTDHSCERMVGNGGFYDPAQIRRLENTAGST